MNEDQPTAEAVGISKGRIVAVGSREEVRAIAEPGAQETDFGDTCILPGLIEPHTHPDLCAQCYAMVDVSGFRHSDVQGVEEALRRAVAQSEPGKWIFAFGLDPMLTENLVGLRLAAEDHVHDIGTVRADAASFLLFEKIEWSADVDNVLSR